MQWTPLTTIKDTVGATWDLRSCMLSLRQQQDLCVSSWRCVQEHTWRASAVLVHVGKKKDL